MTGDRPARRHDLDALRGFAMVLGIALHAALGFLPGFWPAQDDTASFAGPYDEILHVIHGFRMPLFFLLSGFFTAMLWRRRGLAPLVRQRVRRIVFPLALALLTIIPAVRWASEWAIDNRVDDYIGASGDIWTAVALGDTDAVEALLDRGVHPDARQPGEDNTPLHVAAVFDAAETASLLIERGADPDARNAEGSPLEFAVYFGSTETADALVAGGADDLRPPGGDWQDIPWWAAGAGTLEEQGEALGLSGWLSSLHHLWFLWFLVWLVAGFAIVALLVDRFGSGSGPARWSGWVMWAMIPLSLIPQAMMGTGDVPSFGPDTSTGWLPVPHVLAYYALFFAFGALLYGRRTGKGELVDSLGKPWWLWLPFAAGICTAALGTTFGPEASRAWAIVLQAAFAWVSIGALMGLFRALLSRERRGVRYLSDSSYWLYLAHVPLVIALQSLIRHWDLPSGVKYVGLVAATTLLLLATYQLLVRYTPLGTLLNGRRIRPTR